MRNSPKKYGRNPRSAPKYERTARSAPKYESNRAQGRTEDESLKRSHSVVSNLKLTLISLCTALFFAAVYPLFALYVVKNDGMFFALGIAAGLFAVLFGSLLVRFRR